MATGVKGRIALGLVVMALLLGCGKKGTPLPPPIPTPPPTPTPTVEQVLEDQTYTISLEGKILAAEHLTVSESGDQIIVSSELRWLLPEPILERRALVLSQGLNALRYDLERTTLGVRSAWVMERTGEGMVDWLANNQDWLAPVYIRGISPAPHLPLENSPSALPYALMALKYAASGQEEITLNTLDVLEDYPVTQPLTVTLAPERKGAVIGTVALEGIEAGEEEPRFTLWVQPKSRILFSVEVPEYHAGLWQRRAIPPLASGGRMVIQRVSKLPEVPVVTPSGSVSERLVSLTFRGEDGAPRVGLLALPEEGNGPFPCLVIHSADGVASRYDPTTAIALPGWAIFTYDKRGLGQSGGTYERDALRILAEDALLAAQALQARPEIDAQKIVFLGLGNGGRAGALALGLQAEQGVALYHGAILGGVVAGKLFPIVPEYQIRHALAPSYGWDDVTLAAYLQASLRQWERWLFAGENEVSIMRRRASLRALRDLADADLGAALTASRWPVLLLQAEGDVWNPPGGAQAAEEARQAGAPTSYQAFEGLTSLEGPEGQVLADPVKEAVRAWLTEQFIQTSRP